MPVKVQVPLAVAYEYYDTEKRAVGRPARFAVEVENVGKVDSRNAGF